MQRSTVNNLIAANCSIYFVECKEIKCLGYLLEAAIAWLEITVWLMLSVIRHRLGETLTWLKVMMEVTNQLRIIGLATVDHCDCQCVQFSFVISLWAISCPAEFLTLKFGNVLQAAIDCMWSFIIWITENLKMPMLILSTYEHHSPSCNNRLILAGKRAHPHGYLVLEFGFSLHKGEYMPGVIRIIVKMHILM